MIVECPNCSTKYRLDRPAKNEGLKLRCTRCRHVFNLPRNEKSDEEMRQTESEAGNEHDFLLGDVSADEAGGRSRKTRIVVFIVILAAIIGISLYVSLPRIAEHVYIPYLSSDEGRGEVTLKKTFAEDDLRNISLENIRQYFVNNEAIGQMFVIEGRAVNLFDHPRSMVMLRAVLYDPDGEAVKKNEFLCGNIASLFQLQISSREELESILNSRLGVLTTNKYIAPGASTPFMTVFYNPPEDVAEFGLEVIEVLVPAG